MQANNDGKEVIVCTINGEKAFVDDEVKYAIAHGGVLHKDDLAILMMNYEETSEDGTISQKTSPLLISSDTIYML